jgi:hypothetical protein
VPLLNQDRLSAVLPIWQSVSSAPLNGITRVVLYQSYNEFQDTSDGVTKSFDRKFKIYLIMHYFDSEGERKMLPIGE